MSSTVVPAIPHYKPAPPTTVELDYADLAVIDLAHAATPEGRAELAVQVRGAMETYGFFYVINHGYTPAQTQRIFDIADVPFTRATEEEKREYTAPIKASGSYQGYKPRQYWHIANGVRDQQEQYNINHDVTQRPHPPTLRPFLPEIEAFAKHNHFNVLHPILRLLALGLELPENTLVDIHNYSAPGESYVRFMKYYPRNEEDETKSGNVWFKGHTDSGSVSMLWSQPVAALQLLGLDGTWRWVRYIENALVINAGDALDFLSGGCYRATIHRVVRPPDDQVAYGRLGVFYFAFPDDVTRLSPLSESPVLQRTGITRRWKDEDAPTMEEWRKGRASAYGVAELVPKPDERVEEEIISGTVVRHYN